MNVPVSKEVLKERLFTKGLIVEVDEELAEILGWSKVFYNSNGNASRVVGVTLYEKGIVLFIEEQHRIFVEDQEKVIRWLFEKRIISMEKELIKLNQLKAIFYGEEFSTCEFCERIRKMVDDNLR